jgi:hypothetical protein
MFQELNLESCEGLRQAVVGESGKIKVLTFRGIPKCGGIWIERRRVVRFCLASANARVVNGSRHYHQVATATTEGLSARYKLQTTCPERESR